jgi:hypothetical protein
VYDLTYPHVSGVLVNICNKPERFSAYLLLDFGLLHISSGALWHFDVAGAGVGVGARHKEGELRRRSLGYIPEKDNDNVG